MLIYKDCCVIQVSFTSKGETQSMKQLSGGQKTGGVDADFCKVQRIQLIQGVKDNIVIEALIPEKQHPEKAEGNTLHSTNRNIKAS